MTDVQILGAIILFIDLIMIVAWFFISRNEANRVIEEIKPKYNVIFNQTTYPGDPAHVQEDHQV